MEIPLLPDNPVPLVGPVATRGPWTRPDTERQNAAGEALREARVKLWRDLWSKVENVDAIVAERVAQATVELRAENRRLRDALKYAKRRAA